MKLQGVADSESIAIQGEGKTDAGGRFSIGQLGEGNVILTLNAVPDAAAWTVRPTPSISLVAGKLSEARIEIIEGVRVEGVMSTLGKPVAGVRWGHSGRSLR